MGRYTLSKVISLPTEVVRLATVHHSEDIRLNQTLERFWRMEELPKGAPLLSNQEMAVQKHFLDTHQFCPSAGRYMVTLPKRVTTQQLGESYQTAKNRFLRNERSLQRQGNWDHFQKVVQEYLTLGHAQMVSPSELCTPVAKTYCMPMHAVFKSSSSSTKLRVVFDASCPTSSGVALNDILATGPTLHPNLDKILIKFRSYKVAISADIGKMYREVLLSPEDRQLHRFIWREQLDQPLALYCMNRGVTFGVRSSPYAAVRVLQQVATDFGTPGSLEEWHITHSFYVDDLLAGADDTASAIDLYHSLRNLLLKAGFDLKKWRSSSSEVLESIPSDLQEVLPDQQLEDNHTARYPKTLGITWNSRQDVMEVQVQLPPDYTSSKRGIVSDTARSYDVMGWLAPFMLNMKTLFQSLWKKKIDWDEPLPEDIAAKHGQWRDQLSILKNMTLPRCYFAAGKIKTKELHAPLMLHMLQ